jgi:hypothetical protein
MNILILTTYPIRNPRSGGQHRVNNISQSLRNIGHRVENAGVLGSPGYGPEKGFVAYPGWNALRKYIENPLFMEDWAIGQLYSREQNYFNLLSSRISIVPDVIYCEHPWLFAFAEHYNRERLGGRARLVYGSANVEHLLKQSILAPHLSKAETEHAADLVKTCEVAALKAASLVVGVSEQDIAWCRRHTDAGTVLAQNGVPERVATRSSVAASNRITGHRKFALFCASAHPPNMEGFFHFMRPGIAGFAPVERLVVVGGAGCEIQKDTRFGSVAGLNDIYVDAGIVSEDCLGGLLETAHLVIAPINVGQGTNLKTAEALWSGKHVVASDAAMRGFEAFAGSEGVAVAGDPCAFRCAIRDGMARPPLQLSPPERTRRRTLLWDETLRGLADRIGRLQGGMA